MSDKEPFYPVPMTFQYHLKKWPTLFVGYSLMDYNLRLLFKALRWRIDPANILDAYSVDKYPDPLILDVWWNRERYVRFIAQDVWRFVPELEAFRLRLDTPLTMRITTGRNVHRTNATVSRPGQCELLSACG